MNSLKLIAECIDWIKPILIRVFPREWLRKMREKWIVGKSYETLNRIHIKPFKRGRYPDGMNLIGNIEKASGLGQSARLVAAEIEACGIPLKAFPYDSTKGLHDRNFLFSSGVGKELPYNINLIHINPHELGMAFLQIDSSVWNYRYNIGFWLWELEEFPDEWLPCLNCLNEIWTPSEFISRTIREKTDKPVITIPYHVDAEIHHPYSRKELGLPEDRFLFLMMYDKDSMTERKNPKGVLKAYRDAFSGQENVGLVIKVNNCSDEELEYLKEGLQEYRNLYFITETMTRDQVNSLIKESDVLVSLHRAEGFGLVMAEAMLLGTPVIATNWSSNTEFMNANVACMVDYQLVELKEDMGVFKKGNRWADPDISQAAFYMRSLYEDKNLRRRLSENARNHIQGKLSMNSAVAIIEKRVGEIYAAE